MTTSTPTERKSQLQRGIAAARSGRSTEALQILEQVVQAEPGNEMAWLWLSGLVRSNEEKRICLENVLKANPENVYARAGLTRLQDAPPMAADELEARLAFAMGENDAPNCPDVVKDTPPTRRRPLKRLKPPQSANQKRNGNPNTARIELPRDSESTSEAELGVECPIDPDTLAQVCPACDEPISPTTNMCPYCYMPLRSLEDLLGPDSGSRGPGTTNNSRRGRILGSLGSVISV